MSHARPELLSDTTSWSRTTTCDHTGDHPKNNCFGFLSRTARYRARTGSLARRPPCANRRRWSRAWSRARLCAPGNRCAVRARQQRHGRSTNGNKDCNSCRREWAVMLLCRPVTHRQAQGARLPASRSVPPTAERRSIGALRPRRKRDKFAAKTVPKPCFGSSPPQPPRVRHMPLCTDVCVKAHTE